MNRKGFRLPQAATSLLVGIIATCLVIPAAPLAAAQSDAQTDGLTDGQADEQTEKQNADPDDERSVVYSLRDYERQETTATTPEEYINDYAGADGIQRSLEGPDVVITAGSERTVYEYRQGGQLRLVKIIPRIGRPYYLVPADPTRGFGDLDQANRLLPQWKIIEF